MIRSALICFALKEEAEGLPPKVWGWPTTKVLLTGIGRKNAEKAVREFLAGGASVPASRPEDGSAESARLARTPAPPELVLTCGFAGGLDPELKLGDVVFETNPFSSRSRGNETQIKRNLETPHVGSYNLDDKLVAAGARPAKFFCSDRIATTAAEKQRLRLETGADAVEMESGAIQAVCRERGIPCATVRVISDTAGEDLPLDFNALAKPDRNLDYGKLAWAIARAPGKIGALMKLQKKTRFAAGQLASVLEQIVSS